MSPIKVVTLLRNERAVCSRSKPLTNCGQTAKQGILIGERFQPPVCRIGLQVRRIDLMNEWPILGSRREPTNVGLWVLPENVGQGAFAHTRTSRWAIATLKSSHPFIPSG